jgi:hypothetical protein
MAEAEVAEMKKRVGRAANTEAAGFFAGAKTMSSQAKRGGSGGKGPRVGHLDTLTGILKEMGCVYREMRYGSTSVSDGAKLIFALRCLRDVLETLMVEKLEARLDEMAARAVSNAAERQQQLNGNVPAMRSQLSNAPLQ